VKITYRKAEAPRRIAVLHKGLKEYGDYGNSNTLHYHPVNTKVRAHGKIIGYLQDHTFIKPVIGSKHMLRRPPAWAIDAEAFDEEIKPNITEFVVIDKGTGIEYHASVETFDRLKRELDRGFGRQYFLTLNHWQVRGNGHRQLSLWRENSNE